MDILTISTVVYITGFILSVIVCTRSIRGAVKCKFLAKGSLCSRDLILAYIYEEAGCAFICCLLWPLLGIIMITMYTTDFLKNTVCWWIFVPKSVKKRNEYQQNEDPGVVGDVGWDDCK